MSDAEPNNTPSSASGGAAIGPGASLNRVFFGAVQSGDPDDPGSASDRADFYLIQMAPGLLDMRLTASVSFHETQLMAIPGVSGAGGWLRLTPLGGLDGPVIEFTMEIGLVAYGERFGAVQGKLLSLMQEMFDAPGSAAVSLDLDRLSGLNDVMLHLIEADGRNPILGLLAGEVADLARGVSSFAPQIRAIADDLARLIGDWARPVYTTSIDGVVIHDGTPGTAGRTVLIGADLADGAGLYQITGSQWGTGPEEEGVFAPLDYQFDLWTNRVDPALLARTVAGAGRGDDTITARPGGMTGSLGDGDDRFAGARASDIIAGGTGQDRIAGARGNDMAVGQGGNDRLRGDAGSDQLFGGAGRDILNGGTGQDILSGGAGADTFIIAPGTRPDIVTAIDAGDRFHLSQVPPPGGAGAAFDIDRATRTLWVDADGKGGDDAVAALVWQSGRLDLSQLVFD